MSYQTLPIQGFKWMPANRILCANLKNLTIRYPHFQYTAKMDLIVHNPFTNNARYYTFVRKTKRAYVYRDQYNDIKLALYFTDKSEPKPKPRIKWVLTDHNINKPEISGIEQNFIEESIQEMELEEVEDFYL